MQGHAVVASSVSCLAMPTRMMLFSLSTDPGDDDDAIRSDRISAQRVTVPHARLQLPQIPLNSCSLACFAAVTANIHAYIIQKQIQSGMCTDGYVND